MIGSPAITPTRTSTAAAMMSATASRRGSCHTAIAATIHIAVQIATCHSSVQPARRIGGPPAIDHGDGDRDPGGDDEHGGRAADVSAPRPMGGHVAADSAIGAVAKLAHPVDERDPGDEPEALGGSRR